MSINSTTDEGKALNSWYRGDDCLFWDPTGDNWNSRIGAQDFPRVSEAHMPVTPDSEGGSPEWQDLDEIPPDGVDFASADFPNYWTTVEDLKDVANGGGIPNDAIIQALMVTRVDETFDYENAVKFNVREGGDLSADSAERMVQAGASGDDLWITFGGYYPWTPGKVNWTEAVFEACQYGCALISGETDQITVQVIYFGSAQEWTPSVAVTHIRQGVAVGSANPMMF